MEKTKEIEKLLTIIDTLANKPGVFGISNSSEIFHFLQGYNISANQEIQKILFGFNDYVNKLYSQTVFQVNDKEISNKTWNNWIRFMTATDYESITLFKNLVYSYLEEINLKK